MLAVFLRVGQVMVCGLLLWLSLSLVGVDQLEAQAQGPLSTPIVLKAIVGGGRFTCVLTAAGGVKCWGSNQGGGLGDGVASDSWAAVDVVGLESDVQAIAASWSTACALTAEGNLKCWGQGSPAPVAVEGLGNGVQAFALGSAHTCAVTANGGVKCWGWNYRGQLGNGTPGEPQATPVDVIGLNSSVQAVAGGGSHSCALTIGGAVHCWGANDSGQLGDGTTTDRLMPVTVSGLDSGVQAIAAGNAHTCALLADGIVKCWGSNQNGQLGSNGREDQPTPVNVPGLENGVQQIALGDGHACALVRTSIEEGVKCWGANFSGQLGDGTVVERAGLMNVIGLAGGVNAIGLGANHSCALMASGGAKCWGESWAGQLGNGVPYQQALPLPLADLDARVQAISAGARYTCVLAGESETAAGVLCWGDNMEGELGDGTYTRRFQPLAVFGLDSGVTAIATGRSHACALSMAGGVQCWGFNANGQLGDGTQRWRQRPVAVIGLSSGVQAVSAGRGHTCALMDGGGVKCWGDNDGGQLGDGTQLDRTSPVDVVGLGGGVQAVAAGLGLTCALTESGGVKCWGATRVGDGTGELRATPVDAVGLGSGVQAITAGDWHVCALLQGGAVKCWGDNMFGQLGNGSKEESLVPVDVVGLPSGVQQVDASGVYTCAVLENGVVKCWGWKRSAIFNANIFHTVPELIGGVSGRVQSVATGGEHVCVLAKNKGASAGVQCWGDNYSGQLGVNPGWAPLEVLALLPRSLFAPVVWQ